MGRSGGGPTSDHSGHCGLPPTAASGPTSRSVPAFRPPVAFPAWYSTGMEIAALPAYVDDSPFDGWLFYDFRRSNRIAYRALGIDAGQPLTRRWYYLLAKRRPPQKLVSAIEPETLDALPGSTLVYRTW